MGQNRTLPQDICDCPRGTRNRRLASTEILEYYFMQMCGYDRKDLRLKAPLEGEHKNLSGPDGRRLDPTKYHLADSLLRYISSPTGFGSEDLSD